MRTILAGFLMLVSTSLLAGRPECSYTPGACSGGVPSGNINHTNDIASVPEPGTLALIGLGAAGLVVARKRKR
jgi:hypothetical protein